MTLAGKILKHAIATKDKNLELIHDQFKVSPLYNRLLKYKRQSISSQTPEAVDSEEISEDSEIFKHGNLVNKKPGEIIFIKEKWAIKCSSWYLAN